MLYNVVQMDGGDGKACLRESFTLPGVSKSCCVALVRVGTSASDRPGSISARSPFQLPLVLSPLSVLVMSTGSCPSATPLLLPGPLLRPKPPPALPLRQASTGRQERLALQRHPRLRHRRRGLRLWMLPTRDDEEEEILAPALLPTPGVLGSGPTTHDTNLQV